MRNLLLVLGAIFAVCLSSCNNQRVPAFSLDSDEYTNSVGMKFKKIQPGKFMMGANDGEAFAEPNELRHEVEITKPFYIGVFEVTQEQYRRVMQKNPSFFQESNEGGRYATGMDTDSFPVEKVSWYDAQEFCERLNELEAGAPFTYRLPTEAEWEYACRAGTSTAFHFGGELVGDKANVRGTIGYPPRDLDEGEGKFLNRTAPVGSYPPNEWGLYDMSGNVWEWVYDWYVLDYSVKKDEDGNTLLSVDPTGPMLDADATEDERKSFEQKYVKKTIRGGGWGHPPGDARAANRKIAPPDNESSSNGFRVVLVPKT